MKLDFMMPALAKRDDNGGYFLEGIASTTDLDQHKEQMAPSALDDMAKATGVRLTNSHDDELNNHIGDLVESRVSNNEFYAKFKMDAEDPEAMRLWRKVSNGAHAGLSVGGKITATKPGEGVTKRLITGVALEHVALTLKPANPKTMVQAFAKTIHDLNAEDDSTMDNTDLTKTEDVTVDPVEAILTKTAEDLAKVGKSISSANMEKLKSIKDMLGEIMGDDADDVVIGEDEKANAVDPVPGGPAEIKGEANVEKTAKPVLDKEAIAELAKSLAPAVIEVLRKTDRKSVVENDSLEKTETPTEKFAKAQSITDLKAQFAEYLQAQK